MGFFKPPLTKISVSGGALISAKGALMIGQFFNDFSGHYILAAAPKGSARTSLGPM